MPTEYSVNGLTFSNGDKAEEYARAIALRDGCPVHIMEKVDGLPPSRCATITPEI